jgi:hypothetical protein
MAGKIVVSEILSDATSSNTVKIGSGMTLDLNSQGAVTMPTGSVVQVKMGYASTEVETTSNSGASAGLQAVITPSSASSNILVLVGLSLQIAGNSSTTYPRSNYKIIRQISGGSNTDIFPLAPAGANVPFHAGMDANNRYIAWTSYTSHEDSPNTTSAVTYEIWGLQWDGRLMMQPSGVRSNITLMEIAG